MTYLNKTDLVEECRRDEHLLSDTSRVIVRCRKDALLMRTTPDGHTGAWELRYTPLLKNGRLAVLRVSL